MKPTEQIANSPLCPPAPQEPLETSVDFLQTTPDELRRRRDAKAMELREASIAAFGMDEPELSSALLKAATQLEGCCTHHMATLEVETGRAYVTTNRCRNRMCPIDKKQRVAKHAAQVRHLTKSQPQVRFLTLTLDHRPDDLRDQLQRLIKSFRKLRQTKIWKQHVNSSIYTYEITYNPQRDEWHPHIHAIIGSGYIWHAALKQSWRKATGGAFVLKIERPRNERSVEHYITTYISKCLDPEGLPPQRLAEYYRAIKSIRFIGTTGDLHGQKFLPEEPKPKVTIKQLVPLAMLQHHANRGDPRAQELYDYWINLLWEPETYMPPSIIEKTQQWRPYDEYSTPPLVVQCNPPPEPTLYN